MCWKLFQINFTNKSHKLTCKTILPGRLEQFPSQSRENSWCLCTTLRLGWGTRRPALWGGRRPPPAWVCPSRENRFWRFLWRGRSRGCCSPGFFPTGWLPPNWQSEKGLIAMLIFCYFNCGCSKWNWPIFKMSVN